MKEMTFKAMLQKLVQTFKPKSKPTLAEMDINKGPTDEEKIALKTIGIKARIFKNKHPELQGTTNFNGPVATSSTYYGGLQEKTSKFTGQTAKVKNNTRVVHEGGVTFRAMNVPQSIKDQIKETIAAQNIEEKKRVERSGSVTLPLSMARIEKVTEQARHYASHYKGLVLPSNGMEVIEISASGKVADISIYNAEQSKPNTTQRVRPTRVMVP